MYINVSFNLALSLSLSISISLLFLLFSFHLSDYGSYISLLLNLFHASLTLSSKNNKQKKNCP